MKKIILIFLVLSFLLANAFVKAQLSSVINPLDLENVTTVPDKVYVGANFVLSGSVRNIADRSLTGIRLTVQGGFPFSKTSPLTSFYVGSLSSGQTYQFSVPLSIDNDATNQQYTLQFKADYAVYDPAVTKIANVINSETMSATIKVDKGADIEIVNATFPQMISADAKDAEAIVYVQNVGINSAASVQFNLAAQYPFTPSGKTFFIDEIKPGETKAAIFHIDVDSSAAAQTFPLDMTITWKEGNNIYSDTKTFGIPVQVNNLSNSLSSIIRADSLYIIILIVVLLAAGFVFWQRRMKKKSK
jgi:hypothetical protein